MLDVFYREVFPELRYGQTDKVRQQLRNQLEHALIRNNFCHLHLSNHPSFTPFLARNRG